MAKNELLTKNFLNSPLTFGKFSQLFERNVLLNSVGRSITQKTLCFVTKNALGDQTGMGARGRT